MHLQGPQNMTLQMRDLRPLTLSQEVHEILEELTKLFQGKEILDQVLMLFLRS